MNHHFGWSPAKLFNDLILFDMYIYILYIVYFLMVSVTCSCKCAVLCWSVSGGQPVSFHLIFISIGAECTKPSPCNKWGCFVAFGLAFLWLCTLRTFGLLGVPHKSSFVVYSGTIAC